MRAAACVPSRANRSAATYSWCSAPSGACTSSSSEATWPASIASRRSSTTCSASCATSSVRRSHVCGISASISDCFKISMSAERPFVEPELGGCVTVEQRHRKRSDLGLEPIEQRIDAFLDLFGNHQLFAIPCVRDAQLGERFREFGTLVEAPTRQVVVDLDLVGVVGIEVDVEGRRRPGRDLVRRLPRRRYRTCSRRAWAWTLSVRRRGAAPNTALAWPATDQAVQQRGSDVCLFTGLACPSTRSRPECQQGASVSVPRRAEGSDGKCVGRPCGYYGGGMPSPAAQRPDRNLAMELVRVTESAALASARWVGRGRQDRCRRRRRRRHAAQPLQRADERHRRDRRGREGRSADAVQRRAGGRRQRSARRRRRRPDRRHHAHRQRASTTPWP